MGNFVLKYQKSLTVSSVIFVFVFAAGALFTIGSVVGWWDGRTQASVDQPGKVLNDYKQTQKQFPDKTHRIPFVIWGENVLSQPALLELYLAGEKLRHELKEELVDMVDPELGRLGFGLFTIADAVQQTLTVRGLGLVTADEQEFHRALVETFDEGKYGAFVQARVSVYAQRLGRIPQSPALYFFVYAQNPDGQTFQRIPGADPGKEEFNRRVESLLQREFKKAGEILCIACDFNLEAQDEGYSWPILSLIALVILIPGVLVGFAGSLGSWKKTILLAVLGLALVFVCIRGFPVVANFITAGYIKPFPSNDIIMPIAFVVFGADFLLHVLWRYKEELAKTQPRETAFTAALSSIAPAMLIASLTTAAAFGANIVSDVEAVRMFGITGVFSATATFLIMGVFIPLLIYLWERHPQAAQGNRKTSSLLAALTLFIVRRKTGAIGISAAVIVLIGGSAFFASRLQTTWDPTDALSQNSNFLRSLVQQQHFGDWRGEEVLVRTQGEILCTTEGKVLLAEIRQNLEENPYLAHGPEGRLVLPRGEFPVIGTTNGTCATQFMPEVVVRHTRQVASLKEVRESLLQNLQPLEGLAEYGVTGPPFIREASLNAVTGDLVKTMLVAALLILGLLTLIWRSFSLGVAAILPMLFVVILTLGIMGWGNFALNSIIKTITVITLGVGIDYAVYLVFRFRQERKREQDKYRAIEKAASHSGWVVCVTAFTTMLGFAALAAAPMPLIATYGLLGIVIIGSSLLVTIFLLPLLLMSRFIR